MSPQLNKEQALAVNTQNKNILVSAPAGSGKTKILVSRIMRLIEEEKYNVNELLVLTFTKAAANEMKQRLEEAIKERLNQPFDNENDFKHLKKQVALLNQAYISNFHGFCSTLLKQYGYLIGINPNFEIIENPVLIKEETLDKLINNWLENSNYYNLISQFYPSNLSNLKKDIIELDNIKANNQEFISKITNNQITFEQAFEENYQSVIKGTQYSDWIYHYKILDYLNQAYQKCKERYEVLLLVMEINKISTEVFDHCPKGKESDRQLIYTHLNEIKTALDTRDVLKIRKVILKKVKYNNLKAKVLSPAESKIYKDYRKIIFKELEYIATDIIYPDFLSFKESMNNAYNGIKLLINLHKEFKEAYQNNKSIKNLLDFNDLEAYTKKLLINSKNTQTTLGNQLKEIMIDEYQDTNHVQEDMINLIIGDNKNIYRFMVGDMKQSIYRFREADLNIFKLKFDNYGINDNESIRIDLLKNYRSHKSVLDSINFIFNQIMDTKIGGLEYYYDDSAQLNYGFKTSNPQNELEKMLDDNISQEIILIKNSKENKEDEAIATAHRIKKLIQQGYNYGDIAVLMATTTNFITYKKIFNRFNIPCDIALNSGYLQSPEIISIIHALQAFNNPLDDISFMSLLTGNYQFSALDYNLITKELNLISKNKSNLSVYEKLKQSTNPQIIEFYKYFEETILNSQNLYPHEFLHKILVDADYYNFVANLFNGSQRVNNLQLLETSFYNQKNKSLNEILYNYRLSYQQNLDQVPASNYSNDNNTVSFMTIHKSKGLEFKVVILCEMDKDRNNQGNGSSLFFDHNYGLSYNNYILKDIDEFKKITILDKPKYRNFLKYKDNQYELNEKLRLLYVALTRAKEKLILTSLIDDENTIIGCQINALTSRYLNKDTPLIYNDARNKYKFSNWILLSLVSHEDFINQVKESTLFKYYIDIEIEEKIKNLNNSLAINKIPLLPNTKLSKFDTAVYDHENILEMVDELNKKITSLPKLDYQELFNNDIDYQYLEPIQPTEKTLAVTKIIDDGDRDYTYLLTPEDNQIITASERGTIIHRILELLPIKQEINLDYELPLLLSQFNDEQINIILSYKNHIANFIASPVYQEMINNKVYKEKKFTLKENNQIIHGIFDALIIKDNEIIVLDYKTDRLNQDTPDQHLISLHQEQLNYYKKILGKVFPNYSIKAILYYLYIDRFVVF